MGRGRAKAKQTKVARALKYGTVHSDLGALQAELSQPPGDHEPAPVEVEDDLDEDDDPYAQYYSDDSADSDDEAEDEPARRAR